MTDLLAPTMEPLTSPLGHPTVAVILSKKSRTGGSAEDIVRKRLGPAGVFVTSTATIGEFKLAIAKAKELEVDQIWVGGGDGSIRLAAKELLECPIPLGILPLGTGNSLAHELSIPLRLEEAMNLYLGEPKLQKIDVGSFDEEIFVNVATIGLTSEIATEITTLRKGFWGRLVYVPAFFRTLRKCALFHIEVETPDGNLRARVFQFVASSARLHGGPFPVTESASIVDGKLSLYAVKYDGPLTVFRYLRAIAFGKHTELPNVWNLETIEAKVIVRRRRFFVIDGDRMKRRQATICIRPASLTMLVPADLQL